MARYGISTLDPSAGDQLPGATLTINLTGALLLGLLIGALTALAARDISASPLLRPLLGTGILGGYTTFSTFALQSRELPLTAALLYICLSLVLGIALAAVGLAIGSRVIGPRLPYAGQAGEAPVDPSDPDLP